MSENLILAWTHSLPAPARRQLAARVLAHGRSPASTLLLAFAEAIGLTLAEISGLLPSGLAQARVAANALVPPADTAPPIPRMVSLPPDAF